jgi:inner membrane protein
VIDPILTIWTGISAIILFVLQSTNLYRVKIAIAALALSLVYIAYALNNKVIMNKTVNEAITLQRIPAKEFLTTPTPLNSFFWYVVIKSDNGYFTGYHSVLDARSLIVFTYVPSNDSLLNTSRNSKETHQLIRLARGYYAANRKRDTLVFSNLRFGQMNGWENPNAGFVFQYNIGRSDNSLLTVQRGRFSGWNKKTVLTFWSRIKGD